VVQSDFGLPLELIGRTSAAGSFVETCRRPGARPGVGEPTFRRTPLLLAAILATLTVGLDTFAVYTAVDKILIKPLNSGLYNEAAWERALCSAGETQARGRASY